MPFWKGRGLGSGLRTLPQGRDRWGKYSTKGGYILSSLREERLGEKGGAFLKGKEGRVGFRKTSLMVKKDGMILEHTSYRRNRVAENIPFSAESNK